MIAPSAHRARCAARIIEVRGTVEGVGFRPFVWRQAERFGLAGWVRSRAGVIEILAEGEPRPLDDFCAALSADAPPLAHVETIDWRAVPTQGLDGFEVDAGRAAHGDERIIEPDLATCTACLAEMFDPSGRRYRYPFIDCAACGPRFTIVGSPPFERSRTSMRAFAMCDECRAEYEDPADRRFRAETTSCPACGPTVRLVDRRWHAIEADPLERAVEELRGGEILAIKGLGGFHLACDATDPHAVSRLRRRAHRPDEAFPVMVRDLEVARTSFALTLGEERVLSSPEAPIVLVRVREGAPLANTVAPGFRRAGLMLPTTPLHHLVLAGFDRPLVMIGAAKGGDPVCIDDGDARRRLGGVADAFLTHDREIVARCGDPVTVVRRDEPIVLRLGRSFVPSAVELPMVVEPILACGDEREGAFCLARGSRAYVSAGLGVLDSDAALEGFAEALERSRRVLGIDPEAVAHDASDGDLPTVRFARSLGLPTLAVAHHHAHVAAVMAEHRLRDPVIGVVFDGSVDRRGEATDDGRDPWRDGFLVADRTSGQLRGALRGVAMPDDDPRVPGPVATAIAYASDAGCLDAALSVLHTRRAKIGPSAATGRGPGRLWGSAGLLFEAVAALAGVSRANPSYPGRSAVLLEQVAESSATHEYPFDIGAEDDRVTIDTRPTIAAIVRDLTLGRSAGQVAGRFHRTMAAAMTALCRVIKMQTDLWDVCLAGSLFANDLLVSDTAARLASLGFEVFVPRSIPVGEGGLALGQVLVAGARMAEGVT
jgi:hydrogenase maturation protein HypF